MKIGLFTDSYLPSPDGVATSVESSAKELQKNGHEVFIIAPNQPHEKDRKGTYRLVSIRIVKSPEVWWALEIPQPSLFKIANLELDIIHGHSGGSISFLGWQLAQIHNIPFVETYHTLWKYYRHYLLYPNLMKMKVLKKVIAFIGNDCDALITPTIKSKKDLLNDNVKKPIYVLPNGIYTQKFTHTEKGFLHQSFGIRDDKKILLTVGRLSQEKSIDFLIKSYASVHKSFPDTVLVIVGKGKDSESLQKLAVSYGLADSIYFVGTIPYTDMPKVYADADLFLFASQTETQGMVLVEALASGVPVIAVKDDAFIDVVMNGKNGFMVEKDIDTFANKIKSLLHNTELLTKLSSAARESVKQFDVSYTTKILEQIYQEVIFMRTTTEQKHKKINHIINILSNIGVNTHLPKKYKNLNELLMSKKS
jgi:1,2-diacylglycerol 3-alpha-glucosyltransferase